MIIFIHRANRVVGRDLRSFAWSGNSDCSGVCVFMFRGFEFIRWFGRCGLGGCSGPLRLSCRDHWPGFSWMVDRLQPGPTVLRQLTHWNLHQPICECKGYSEGLEDSIEGVFINVDIRGIAFSFEGCPNLFQLHFPNYNGNLILDDNVSN